MKYFNTYKNFSQNIELFDESFMSSYNKFEANINSLNEGFGDIFKKAKTKFTNWAVKAPKIKKLQEKANTERMKAVKVQVETRKMIEKALAEEKDIDVSRVKQVMLKKVAIHLNMADKHEAQVDMLVNGNSYLEKIKNVIKYKGEIERNNAMLSKATEEEKFEMEEENAEYRDQIDIDMDDIDAKLKYEKDPESNEEPISKKGSIKSTNLKRIEKKGFTENELGAIETGMDLFLKRALNEIIAKREGKTLRNSSNTTYKMIDEIIDLANKEKISLNDAYIKVAKKYDREDLIRPVDKILKDKKKK